MSENLAIVGAIIACVNLLVTIGGGYGFMMAIKSRQAVQDVLLDNLSRSITRLDRTVEDLRRGDGWIQSPRHANIDREYPPQG